MRYEICIPKAVIGLPHLPLRGVWVSFVDDNPNLFTIQAITRRDFEVVMARWRRALAQPSWNWS